MTQAQSITATLRGKWLGTCGLVRCPVHEDRSPSLQVSDGRDGLRVHCHAGCDWRAVKDALKKMFGDSFVADSGDRPPVTHEPDHSAAFKKAKAKTIWTHATPIGGSLAEKYLRGRGITIALPRTLRVSASLRHPATGQYFPAMVGLVSVWPSREVSGVHRTYLRTDGSGKADLQDSVKAMLGPCRGGAVRLAAPTETLAVCEGIETGLSVMQAASLPVWAALSTTGMVGLVLPPLPLGAEIVICGDNDGPGIKAANEAAAKWTAEGRKVRISFPPVSAGKDFNDALAGAA